MTLRKCCILVVVAVQWSGNVQGEPYPVVVREIPAVQSFVVLPANDSDLQTRFAEKLEALLLEYGLRVFRRPALKHVEETREAAVVPMEGNATTTMLRLQTVVASMPGAHIIKAEPTYLYAQFTTRLMKYVDDVEFSIDEPAKLIHVRSASRLGQEDFNANRDRIEAVRAKLASAP